MYVGLPVTTMRLDMFLYCVRGPAAFRPPDPEPRRMRWRMLDATCTPWVVYPVGME